MRGGAPPDLLFAQVTVTTGAIGITTQTQIVAAPGADRRIRVWAFHAGIRHSSPVGISDVRLRRALGSYMMSTAIGSADSRHLEILIPGGIAASENTLVNVETQSSAAAMILACGIYYTVEDV